MDRLNATHLHIKAGPILTKSVDVFLCSVKADLYSYDYRDATSPVALLLPSHIIHFSDSHFMFIFANSGDPSTSIGPTRNCSEPLPQRGKFMAFKPQHLRSLRHMSDEFFPDYNRTQC